MIPAGYMAKHVAARPDGLKANQVKDIYSVSNCISDDFADYINLWKHNWGAPPCASGRAGTGSRCRPRPPRQPIQPQ